MDGGPRRGGSIRSDLHRSAGTQFVGQNQLTALRFVTRTGERVGGCNAQLDVCASRATVTSAQPRGEISGDIGVRFARALDSPSGDIPNS